MTLGTTSAALAHADAPKNRRLLNWFQSRQGDQRCCGHEANQSNSQANRSVVLAGGDQKKETEQADQACKNVSRDFQDAFLRGQFAERC